MLLDDLELRARARDGAVDLHQASPGDEREHGQNRPDDDEGGSRANRVHDRGRCDRADPHRAHGDGPDDAEHARQDLVRHDPLKQRERRDVLDAVRRTDDREQQDRDGEVAGRRHERDREPPEDERQAEGRREPAADERRRHERTDETAHAERGRQVAHGALARVEHLEDGDHDQDVQAAADEALGRDQGDDEAGLRLADHGCEAGEEHPPGIRRLGLREHEPALDPNRGEEHRRGRECEGAGGEDDTGVGEREDQTRRERPEQRSKALDRRGRAVRGDQLRRISRERGEQRLERRPHERRGDTDRRCQADHEDLVPAQRERRSRTGQRRRADERVRDEEPLPTEAISQRGREGCEQRRRQQPDEPGDPDGERSARLVGEDTERDEVHPLGDDRRAPAELGPPELPVSPDPTRARERLHRPSHPSIERGLAARGKGGERERRHGCLCRLNTNLLRQPIRSVCGPPLTGALERLSRRSARG